MAYFPFMIQMDDKICLIAGGGTVALRKVETMLEFGAVVKVVAPKINDEIYNLSADNDKVIICKRKIEEADLKNADVVIMATDDSKLNEKFARICKDKKILVNVVDVKKDCGFYFPAIIKQEDVVVSVSTGGKSPLLAAKIKQDINKSLRKDYGKIARELGEERQKILKSYDSEAERKKVFKQMVEEKMRNNTIKIGTRGSKLAIIQTDMVIEALKNKHPEYNYEKVILTTKGDRQTDRPITSFGGKAVFVEEFENAILDGTIHMAVHSAKDMPNPCKEGLCVGGVLKRACEKDVLIYRKETKFDKETEIVIGTSSLRRQCQIKEIYPNAICKDLRGNIGTRINKLKDGEYDAIILAAAGIERQGLDNDEALVYDYLPTDKMLPAAGQAIIAIEVENDGFIKEIVKDISDVKTQIMLDTERKVLTKLNAGCHEPIGVLSTIEGQSISLSLMQFKDNKVIRKNVSGSINNIEDLIEKL